MPNGLGFAEEDEDILDPKEVSVPSVFERTSTDLGQSRSSSDIENRIKSDNLLQRAKNDPILRVGLALSNFAAGMRGQELPTDKLRRQQLAQDELAMRRLSFQVSAFKEIQNIVDRAPPAQRESVIKAFEGQFKDNFPELGEFLRDATDPTVKLELANSLGEHGPTLLRLTNNNPSAALELAQNKELMATLNNAADTRNRPIATAKLSQLIEGAGQTGGLEIPGIPQDENGNIQLENFAQIELFNALVKQQNPNAALSDSEIGTLRRNPDILLSLGIVTPELQQQRAEQKPSIDFSINQEGKRVAVGIDPITGEKLFETEVSELEKNVDASEVKLGAQLIASGKSLSDDFSNETKALLGDFTQEDAAAFIESGKGSGITVKPDGTIQIGGQSNKKQLQELQEQEIAVRNVVREAGRLADISQQDPGITSTARGLVSIAASASANIDELVNIFDLDTSNLTIKQGVSARDLEGNSTLRKQFEELFPQLAGRTASFQSAAFNLAYMVAASRGTTGRALSDKELATTITNLGADRDDPFALQAAMKEVQRQVVEKFKTTHQVIKGTEFNDLDNVIKEGTQFSALSDEQLQEQINNAANLTVQERAELRKELSLRGD